TGLAHHNERRRTRQMALSGGGPIEMATEEVEEAIKQALNTADDD
ncbi:MAG: 4-alpha-glucanotransferase, partial [Chromatiaceae bacterium]|nr:4-alpha-glucanotransferase [Chromatiaceae bacterium]